MEVTYDELLDSKKTKTLDSGFIVNENDLNPKLKAFQKFSVAKALKAGRFALFQPPGSGKTIQQLEWGWQIYQQTDRPVLLLAPLAVIGQTIEEEAPKFGYEVKELNEKVTREDLLECGIWAINYDSLHKYMHLIKVFSGVILDESSILKNFTGQTKKFLMDVFKNTPFKLPCSATPAPNDLNEYGNHSEFLGILDAQDMRAKWFVRDEGMNNYRLKGHAKADFYAWLSTWCIMFDHPSDIGFIESGYDLPDLNLIERQIKTAHRDNGKLYNDVTVNATSFSKELKLTKAERLNEVAEIVNNSTEIFCIWVTLDSEAEELLKLIPGAINVTGSDKKEDKKRNLLDFGKGLIRVLITKTKLAMYGLNWQVCHNTIFASFNFSFEALYQAIRRFLRFGQTNTVNCWLMTTDTMQNVIGSIRLKEQQHNDSIKEVSKAVNGQVYGLINDYEFKEVKNDWMWLMKGDTVIEQNRLKDNSVHLIVYSPPFSSLFTYSNYIHDLGNNVSHADFFKQYKYVLQQDYRTLMPGRLIAFHTKNLGVYKNSSGYSGMYDFTGEHRKAVEEVGFRLHCIITIWTDPVLEMQRTKTQRLLYKTLTSDSSHTGVGMPEFIYVFKKWEGNQEDWTPINHITKKNFPLEQWQEYASPVFRENLMNYSKEDLIQTILYQKAEIFKLRYNCNEGCPSGWYSDVWFDIKRTDVLNNKEGTAMGDEKHIAPLQLEVIKRIINLWSNPGEVVKSSFGGIGSEPYVALKEGRKAISVELKDSYYETMVKNCMKVLESKKQSTLFDLVNEEVA